MDINIIQLVVIVVLAGLAWWVNEQLNPVPVLKNVVSVVIVVVAILLVLQSLGFVSGSSHIRISG